jgi:hypothetical protein
MSHLLDIASSCIPAFIIGWIFNRKLGIRVASWVWLAGIAWLLYGVWGEYQTYRMNPYYHAYDGSFAHLVWRRFFVNEGEHDGPLYLLVFTYPALGLLAFSLGARLSRRRVVRA